MAVKTGMFYAVGVGPGDPELLTVKALRVLERCPVIAAPQTKNGAMLALEIARQAQSLEGKTILPLSFAMERDEEKMRLAHLRAADAIEEHLAAGRDTAMLNLGDVSIYATCGYLIELLENRGYETVIVPGVPSFCAAAARLGMSLTTMNAPLHIVPAGGGPLDEMLALPGTKVLMKSGKEFLRVLDTLRREELLRRAAMVQDCGLATEKVYPTLEDAPEQAGYFTTIIVKE